MRLTKGFMAIFAPAESLPSPATLTFTLSSPKNKDVSEGENLPRVKNFAGYQIKFKSMIQLYVSE